MFAYLEKTSTEKDNLQCCFVKIKFAVFKIFKQILSKDTAKLPENNNNNNFNEEHFTETRENKVNSKFSFTNEIEQNQANERLLKAAQQRQPPYVLAMETTVGSFYWDWECGMQRDSFADFNFNTH